jgi:RND family efflux transporter MFP subunit
MSEQRHNELGIHPLAGADGAVLEDLPGRRQMLGRTRILTLVVLVALALGAGRTVLSRLSNSHELEAGTVQRAKNYVKTDSAAANAQGQALILPGTLQGFVQSPISARASGYLKRWTVDIGGIVEKGQVLAEIETPEIDQQLAQAVAARDQATASLNLARSTLARWESLRQKDVVSQQDLDERRGAADQARANVAAAQANVQRLQQTEGFKRIIAPFSGILTRRNVDVGDLIDAGSGRPLFVLSQTDPLRIYINVPQSYAHLVKQGQTVAVTQSELGGQTFKGEIARTAGSLDSATRTMQVEVALPNPTGALLPGAYVQVQMQLAPSDALVIPANALLFRSEGTRVGVVDAQGKVTLRAVTLGRNYGRSVEVLDGLAATDRFILNPSDSLASGDQVVVAPPASPAAAPAAGSSK